MYRRFSIAFSDSVVGIAYSTIAQVYLSLPFGYHINTDSVKCLSFLDVYAA
jgi:hypothetical protein